jgi:hypothetical protein
MALRLLASLSPRANSMLIFVDGSILPSLKSLFISVRRRNKARMAIGLRTDEVRGEPSRRMPSALGSASG